MSETLYRGTLPPGSDWKAIGDIGDGQRVEVQFAATRESVADGIDIRYENLALHRDEVFLRSKLDEMVEVIIIK